MKFQFLAGGEFRHAGKKLKFQFFAVAASESQLGKLKNHYQKPVLEEVEPYEPAGKTEICAKFNSGTNEIPVLTGSSPGSRIRETEIPVFRDPTTVIRRKKLKFQF